MKPLRVGIIGTGFGADVHAPIMQSHPGFDVISVCSVARGNIGKVQKQTGIENIYIDWKEMLEKEQLDLVSIAAIPSLHCEMAVTSFSYGAHVLCEKPMALNLDETKKMMRAQEKSSRSGFVNFEWRFLSARQIVKKILSEEQIGKVLHIDYDISFPGYHALTTENIGWAGQQKNFGGMLGAMGSHMIDSILWWMDEEVSTLIAQLNVHIPEFTDEHGITEYRDADDSFFISGKFKSGTTFKMQLMSAANHGFGSVLKIYGSKGTVVLNDDQIVQLGFENQSLENIDIEDILAPKDMPYTASRYYPAFKPFLDKLYEAIVSHRIDPDLPTFSDGHKTQAILDAVRQSSDKGIKVRF
ncbi:Gfo/Idh/MocA family oxidoreductase [Fictibacillus sp. Mic-4]|uniref:Gfo/Idh/MocA family protein n=1 Tax=Fictibacillus sp. Mic-4 TaxID=3132826 RepID=UPI003CECAFC3